MTRYDRQLNPCVNKLCLCNRCYYKKINAKTCTCTKYYLVHHDIKHCTWSGCMNWITEKEMIREKKKELIILYLKIIATFLLIFTNFYLVFEFGP